MERRILGKGAGNLSATCTRCNSEFPIAKEPAGWQLGKLRLLSRASKKVRSHWSVSNAPPRSYICGNCWFDITDEAIG